MDMEQLEKELRRKEEKMEIEAAEKAKRKIKESLLEDLVGCSYVKSSEIVALQTHSNLSANEVLANHVASNEPLVVAKKPRQPPSLLASTMV